MRQHIERGKGGNEGTLRGLFKYFGHVLSGCLERGKGWKGVHISSSCLFLSCVFTNDCHDCRWSLRSLHGKRQSNIGGDDIDFPHSPLPTLFSCSGDRFLWMRPFGNETMKKRPAIRASSSSPPSPPRGRRGRPGFSILSTLCLSLVVCSGFVSGARGWSVGGTSYTPVSR